MELIMKKKALKQLSRAEMEAKLPELHLELLKANGQVAIGTTPKNPGAIRGMKRTIARIHTYRNQPMEGKKI